MFINQLNASFYAAPPIDRQAPEKTTPPLRELSSWANQRSRTEQVAMVARLAPPKAGLHVQA